MRLTSYSSTLGSITTSRGSILIYLGSGLLRSFCSSYIENIIDFIDVDSYKQHVDPISSIIG